MKTEKIQYDTIMVYYMNIAGQNIGQNFIIIGIHMYDNVQLSEKSVGLNDM